MCFKALVVLGMVDVLVVLAYVRLVILVYVRLVILVYVRLAILVIPCKGGPLSCWTQCGN